MKNDSAQSEAMVDDRNKYELMVIINPDIGEDATKKRLGELRKLIATQKGEIFFEDLWGMRDLAYRIKKLDRGYYAVFDFMLLPEMLKEIDATLRLDPEVLRHMMVTLPFKYTPKSFAVVEEEKPAVRSAVAAPAPKKATEVKKEEPAAKAAEPAETTKAAEPVPAEVAAEAAEESPKKKEKKETTLEDVDAKLKSIIDNPDINF